MLVLGDADSRTAPWAMLHVTWTEWKNMFSLEVYCRTAKLVVDGLVRSYGPQTLRIYRMGPELGPPRAEERTYGDGGSLVGSRMGALRRRDRRPARPLLGGLDDAHYAWARVQDAYAARRRTRRCGRRCVQ